MAVASGKLTQKGGEQADLFGVRSTGQSPAWQLNPKSEVECILS